MTTASLLEWSIYRHSANYIKVVVDLINMSKKERIDYLANIFVKSNVNLVCIDCDLYGQIGPEINIINKENSSKYTLHTEYDWVLRENKDKYSHHSIIFIKFNTPLYIFSVNNATLLNNISITSDEIKLLIDDVQLYDEDSQIIKSVSQVYSSLLCGMAYAGTYPLMRYKLTYDEFKKSEASVPLHDELNGLLDYVVYQHSIKDKIENKKTDTNSKAINNMYYNIEYEDDEDDEEYEEEYEEEYDDDDEEYEEEYDDDEYEEEYDDDDDEYEYEEEYDDDDEYEYEEEYDDDRDDDDDDDW